MSNLISGKEALIALANGENVEYYKHEWMDVNRLSVRDLTSVNSVYKFRLKPKTIMFNGVEIPAPFDPKKGDGYFFPYPNNPKGYGQYRFNSSASDSDYMQFGAWRTEDEIKQVVEALRNIFKGVK